MGIKKKILDALGFFLEILQEKTLQTLEEVDANTTDGYWAGAGAVNELYNKLNGCSLEQDGEDFYIVGADSVRKKLCNNDIYIRTRIIRPTEAWRIIDLCLDVSYDGATWNNLFTERLQVGTDGGTAYGFSKSIKYTVTAI